MAGAVLGAGAVGDGVGVGAGGFGDEGFGFDGFGALPTRGLRGTGARTCERDVLTDRLAKLRRAFVARVR